MRNKEAQKAVENMKFEQFELQDRMNKMENEKQQDQSKMAMFRTEINKKMDQVK